MIYSGQPSRAFAVIENARRHDPLGEARYSYLEGLAHFTLDEFDAAATAFERTLELNPDLWNPEGDLSGGFCYPCVALIATYGQSGRVANAKPLLERMKEVYPCFNARTEVVWWSFRGETDVARFTEGLIKAGAPQ